MHIIFVLNNNKKVSSMQSEIFKDIIDNLIDISMSVLYKFVTEMLENEMVNHFQS